MEPNSIRAATDTMEAGALAAKLDDAPAPVAIVSNAASSNSTDTKKTRKKTPKKKHGKRYNGYNIFFMLERQLILRSRGGGINAIENPINTSHLPLIKLKKLVLPPLCIRYSHLPMTADWFLELQACQQGKARPHTKIHGLIPFKELAQLVAKNYREIDKDTQTFINEVIERLGRHYDEVEAIEEKMKEEGTHRESRRPIKKRKSFPVLVSVPRTANKKAAVGSEAKKKRLTLSNDEVATVQQLIGMPTHDPTRHDLAGHPAAYPQALNSACSPVSAQSVPTHHDPDVRLQGQSRADSESGRLHAELACAKMRYHAMHARLERETNPAGHFPANNLQRSSPPADSESYQLRLEIARAVHDRRESERRIEHIRLLQEQMNLANHHTRIGQEYNRHPRGHTQAYNPPIATSSPRDFRADFLARYYGQHHSTQAGSFPFRPLPAARTASMPTRAPEISASGITSYLARLEEELQKETRTQDNINANM